MIFGLALAGAYSKGESRVTSHGYKCRFRHHGGATTVFSASGFGTAEEARADAREMAVKLGYRTPRWWEVWRYKDSSLLLGADKDFAPNSST